jgi:chemotaxis protein methyltransferase WspC
MKLPSDPRLAELDAEIARRTGLDLRLVGDNSLRRAVGAHMKEEQLDDGDACIDELLRSQQAFAAFIERLLIPETWFFRDREPFRCLQEFAARRSSRVTGEPLRVLSIPCSTGEEPYSCALALFDAGFSAARFHIDAVDLSGRSLARAREGIFSRASFRGDEAPFADVCNRYFEQRGETLVASPALRRAVTFLQANLLAPDLLADRGIYHFILCRNVLIYMTPEARCTSLSNLHRLLSPDGILYAGHVEARLVRDGAFLPSGREYPCAFSPEHPASASVVRPAATRLTGARQARAGVRRHAPQTPAARPAPSRPPRRMPSTVGAGSTEQPLDVGPQPVAPCTEASVSGRLAAAQRAADQGHFEETRQICLELLEREPANAEANFLMGVVSSATGRSVDAEAFYRQVLYLEPRHAGALTHMMLLAQQRGDAAGAENFRRRAQGVRNGEQRQ